MSLELIFEHNSFQVSEQYLFSIRKSAMILNNQSQMYQIALNKYGEYKTRLESTRKPIDRAPPKQISNLFGSLFSGIMKKINPNEPNLTGERPVSNTQNTTFTNISYTASSNQMTEFNSDSLSPSETHQVPVANFVKLPTKPKKLFPKKPKRQVIGIPKPMAPPPFSNFSGGANPRTQPNTLVNRDLDHNGATDLNSLKTIPKENQATTGNATLGNHFNGSKVFKRATEKAPNVPMFGKPPMPPARSNDIKRKNKFKGNRFVAFDINKL